MDVYSFTATDAGLYSFAAVATGEGVDTLIYARSFCADFVPAFELECNDDVEFPVDFNGGFQISLEADQTIYIFVDSYNGANAGPYTMSASFDGM